MTTLIEERDGPVRVLTIDRPKSRNAIDPPTAVALRRAFAAFEADAEARVLVLTGAGGHFCAGADLNAVATGAFGHDPLGDGPLGPTRAPSTKPMIAAV
ncbi:MAG: enoyl-CoA hydratase/isomerase family protein, partial [Acetobacteraceae bacterium]|nr:enoyl-CoA hydratase/isomerase family protein [Acetobacteraceae bacterium]